MLLLRWSENLCAKPLTQCLKEYSLSKCSPPTYKLWPYTTNSNLSFRRMGQQVHEGKSSRLLPSRVHLYKDKQDSLSRYTIRQIFFNLPFHKGCRHFKVLVLCSCLSSNSYESSSKSHLLSERFLRLTNPPMKDNGSESSLFFVSLNDFFLKIGPETR